MTSLSDIGIRLIQARRAQGLSQRELAQRVGAHQQQIARWEQEKYGCVSLARLSRVAQALGVGWMDAEQPLLAAEESGQYGAGTALVEPLAESGVAPVRDLGEIIARIRTHVPELHERFGVTRIAVFGSFARGEQRPDSDVDLIVEVEHPSLENVFGAEEAISTLLGRKADSGAFESLRPRVQRVVREELVDVWRT